ncbi:unnamed protein product [Blepharisma stoltei]|uniref:Uncharacterized protein n=1 Tax=Blepharisma stoltei TaxID=1481888 RepID=A0AAU9J386_9CILI|nr:unnamed protein product [Blepharisma stoltei]
MALIMIWSILYLAYASAIKCEDAALVSCLTISPTSDCFKQHCTLEPSQTEFFSETLNSKSINLIQAPKQAKSCDLKCVNSCSANGKMMKECSELCNCFANNNAGFVKPEDVLSKMSFEIPKEVFEVSNKKIEIEEILPQPEEVTVTWNKFEDLQEVVNRLKVTNNSCQERCILNCGSKSGNCVNDCISDVCEVAEKPYGWMFLAEVLVVGAILIFVARRFLTKRRKPRISLVEESEAYYTRLG